MVRARPPTTSSWRAISTPCCCPTCRAWTRAGTDAALRLVQLVDEFYDRHVNLLLSAAADPFSLYRGRRHEREFERTSSRLVEMRSAQYLAREHRP